MTAALAAVVLAVLGASAVHAETDGRGPLTPDAAKIAMQVAGLKALAAVSQPENL